MVQPGTPPGVPESFDCAVRKLAYEYGRSLQPQRGEFRRLFEALQLEFCGMSVPRSYDAYVPPSFPVPTGGVVFVSPTGSDSSAGTADAPFATIRRALEAVSGKGNQTVVLRGGRYFLSEAVTIGPEHSGVTIQNYPTERVEVSGGQSLTVPQSAWTPYKRYEGFDKQSALNNVYGSVDPGKDTDKIKFLGTFQTVDQCIHALEIDKDNKGPYTSYTFHELAVEGPYAGQCFGRTDSEWKPTAQKHIISGVWVRQNVWRADLRSLGKDMPTEMPALRLNGKRVIRAKYPNGDPEQSGGFLRGAKADMGGGDYVNGWMPLSAATVWVPPKRKPDSEEIVITAADWPSVEWPMTEAGGSTWTGEGDWGEFHMGYGGYCDDLDPPFGYWCAMHPPRGQSWDKKNNKGRGGAQTHMSPDGMVLERAQNYSDPTTAVVQSWRGGGRWFTQQWKVQSFVKEDSILMFDPSTGMQGGEGMTNSGQWWIENVKEECDDANEWFFDEKEQVLYFNPNTTDARSGPTGDEQWVVPLTRTLFDIRGSQAKPVIDVRIRGLVLTDTRPTYLDPHGMPSGGDWALQRSAAVVLEGTERASLSDSLLTRLDGNGVGLNGFNMNASIERNEFSLIGDTAMFAWGYTGNCLNENCTRKLPHKVGPDGRGGEQPHFTHVADNLVYELGLWQKQSSMWFQAVTTRTTLERNIHFNGPRAGVNFNDGFGGGDVMRGNLLFNCVRESGDHGPFNSWDRVPYITTLRTGRPSVIPLMREIVGNFIISNYASQEAIDTDDGSAYYNTHDNFFVYAARGEKSDFGGHDNHHNSNVYAYVSECWSPGNSNTFINNTCIANSDTGGFKSDCERAPLSTISGNTLYNSEGSWHVKICDKSNTLGGKWPSDDDVLAMGRRKLHWPGAWLHVDSMALLI